MKSENTLQKAAPDDTEGSPSLSLSLPPILSRLRIARFRFVLQTLTPMTLPTYKGSILRGKFGHTLKKVICTARCGQCDACILKPRCLYIYLFETEAYPGYATTGYSKDLPRPFVLVPPLDGKQSYQEGETFSFELVLIGKAVEYLPYFIFTVEEIGRSGMRQDSGRYRVVYVEHIRPGIPPQVIYSGEKRLLQSPNIAMTGRDLIEFWTNQTIRRISIQFITPIRLKHQEHLSNQPEFHILFRRLLDRIIALSSCHEGISSGINLQVWKKDAEKIRLTAHQTWWHDWERYSNRQGTRMKLGGLLGTVTYEGDITPFLPFLALGEWVHVGKGATFGLGKYRIIREDNEERAY